MNKEPHAGRRIESCPFQCPVSCRDCEWSIHFNLIFDAVPTLSLWLPCSACCFCSQFPVLHLSVHQHASRCTAITQLLPLVLAMQDLVDSMDQTKCSVSLGVAVSHSFSVASANFTQKSAEGPSSCHQSRSCRTVRANIGVHPPNHAQHKPAVPGLCVKPRDALKRAPKLSATAGRLQPSYSFATPDRKPPPLCMRGVTPATRSARQCVPGPKAALSSFFCSLTDMR